MKILITGSYGFLGRNLCTILKKQGHYIIEYDYAKDKTHDIRNKDKFMEVVSSTRPDVCVHLAAIANLNHYDDDLSTGSDINIKGSINIMDVCESYGVKVIFASTCCCYGDNKLQVSNELSNVVPTEPYSKSKRSIELEILERNKTNNNVIICRLATFYGTKLCRRELATSLFIEKIYNGECIKIHGDGTQNRTYTHVYDMCSGFAAIINAIDKKQKTYEIYNITRSIPISVMDIVDAAAKHLNKKANVEFVKDRGSQFNQLVIENKRLRELGWVPKYSFDDGMRELVESFLNEDPKCKWVL